eukprot:CAMPEP_0171458188 /NCGR_PEP_ID=MMETSP0945-20130129/3968_1 /TAXON_ID=109269 /ORGANISM="Vaucheria litorea, Strain CCMP2940" /LENGTH=631 /DNA_ID=CAMNT_0011983949 /DNA_START=37 /DNA_END=1932 /DNA_ORIENTATION=+
MVDLADANEISEKIRSTFSAEQLKNFESAFKSSDSQNMGFVYANEVKGVLELIGGEIPSERQIEDAIKDADADHDSHITFEEFLQLMLQLKGEPIYSSILKPNKQNASKLGSRHHYSNEERAAFTDHINHVLRRDQVLAGRLPMSTDTEQLFTEVADGLVLAKFINYAEFDTIDERALNVGTPSKPLNIFQKVENMNLALNAAKSIGCIVTNVDAKDVIDGNPILILGLIWQIMRIQLLSSISLTSCPELVALLKEGEVLEDLVALQPEAILMRWVNYQLKIAGSEKIVKNFGRDMVDATAFNDILYAIDPNLFPRVETDDPLVRAANAIRNAKNLGVETFIQPSDIATGNKKLMLAFVAQIFNKNPNLTVEAEVLEEVTENIEKEMDEIGDTREEKVFRLWINSLGLDRGRVYINNLFSDVQDGVVILRVMDRIDPGSVSWKRVNDPPKNLYKKVENGNYVIDIAKNMNLSVVNVGGLDIIKGNHKMILAIMWQLMRKHTLDLLQELSPNKDKRIEDPEIMKWANSKAEDMEIHSFNDPSISSGIFLLKVCQGINRNSVNWDLVDLEPDTNEKMIGNVKYAISVARKLGALLFAVPEDFVEVRSRMIMLFCAALWHAEIQTKFMGFNGVL